MSLFDHGDQAWKGAIHGATLVLAVEMSAYNWLVFKKRGGRWHLWSSIIYGSLSVLETVQVLRHID